MEKNNKSQSSGSEDFVDEDFELEETEEIDLQQSDKLKKLRTELKTCQSEKQEFLSGWQRSKADYVNLKNEFERKKMEISKFSNENILRDLLAVADSFNMAFADKESWEKTPENWRKGVEYIYNQFENTLKSYGIKKIDALGQIFDPAIHEAIEEIEVDNKDEDNKVIMVAKEGYKLHEKILRASQVKVGHFKK